MQGGQSRLPLETLVKRREIVAHTPNPNPNQGQCGKQAHRCTVTWKGWMQSLCSV